MKVWRIARGMSLLHGINGLLAAVVIVVALVHAPAAVRLTALVGSVWLASILLSPLLAGWLEPRVHGEQPGNLASLQAAAQTLVRQRKQLGLWAAAWLLAHAGMSIMIYFGGFSGFVSQLGRQPVTILEVTSLGILLVLAATSNNWSRQHLPGWRYIHLSIWAIPGMVLASSIMAARDTLGQLPLLTLAPILFAACLVAGIVGFIMKRRRQFTDWLRVAFLLAGCLAAYIVWNAA